jgi:beta-N-acetylhexosaminidase
MVMPSFLQAVRVPQIIPQIILPRSSTKKFRQPAATKKLAQEFDLSHWSIEDKIGQLLIVGYRSEQQIENLKVGGVVLFSWNVEGGIEKTQKLIATLQQKAKKNLKVPLFVATDQEGGRVLRIRRGMTPFPDASAIGALEDPYVAFQVGREMGLELSSIGVNMNFAPVLDLGNAKSFLGNRVWGAQADKTAQSAVSFIRGQRASGVLAVAKHYPGHGKTEVDSHFHLPVIPKTRKQLFAEDLTPFRLAIDEGVLAMMTAHVQYPKIDQAPASLSKIFLQDILRDELGFEGLIITDDLEMDGVKSHGENQTYGELALKALESGSDMILLVWSQNRQKEIFKKIRSELSSGRLSEAWLDAKVQRILRVKEKSIGLDHNLFVNPYWRQNLRRKESLFLAEQIKQGAVRWVAGPKNLLKKQLREKRLDAWNVWVPSNKTAEAWRDKRPQDRVSVYSARGSSSQSFIKGLERQVKQEKTSPLILVTPPRREINSETFESLIQIMGKQAMRKLDQRPVVWIHQGPQPLRLRKDVAKFSLGLVSLNSDSDAGLESVINGL